MKSWNQGWELAIRCTERWQYNWTYWSESDQRPGKRARVIQVTKWGLETEDCKHRVGGLNFEFQKWTCFRLGCFSPTCYPNPPPPGDSCSQQALLSPFVPSRCVGFSLGLTLPGLFPSPAQTSAQDPFIKISLLEPWILIPDESLTYPDNVMSIMFDPH